MISNKICAIVDLEPTNVNLKNINNNEHIALLPVFGKYKIIDFVLSSLVNEGINNVSLMLAQTDYPLLQYVKNGKWWNLDRKLNGLAFVFHPSSDLTNQNNVRALYHNLFFLTNLNHEYLLLTNIETINLINYQDIDQKLPNGYDALLLYQTKTNNQNLIDLPIVNFDSENLILSFGFNSGISETINYDTGIFLFHRKKFIKLIQLAIMQNPETKIQDYLRRHISQFKIYALSVDEYIMPLNTVENYYHANLDFIKNPKLNNLEWLDKIKSAAQDYAPTFYGDTTKLQQIVVGSGCYINSNIINSIVFPNVILHRNSVIENCIIMSGCKIGRNVKLKNVILSKSVCINENKEIINDQDKPLVIGYKAVL